MPYRLHGANPANFLEARLWTASEALKLGDRRFTFHEAELRDYYRIADDTLNTLCLPG